MKNCYDRKAISNDLQRLVEMLLEDELGSTRESKSFALDEHYIKAFHKMDSDRKWIVIQASISWSGRKP